MRYALCALFAALTAVLSPFSIPLPGGEVPLSLSVAAVFLAGGLLPARLAAFSQIVYLLLGLAGAPVFAGFKAGPAGLFGPTGGYLWAYPLMAALIALIPRKTPVWMGLGMLASLLPCYALGSFWLGASTGIGFARALAAGVLPFVAADVIKAAVCSAGAHYIRRALGARLSLLAAPGKQGKTAARKKTLHRKL